MNIDIYKAQYDNPALWFTEEVKQPHHINRIANVLNNRNYLSGKHKVLQRENAKYKGKELVTRKTIINYAKTIINFHDTFILGKPVSITGDNDNLVNAIRDVYKYGDYNSVDYQIIDRVNKFGDAYEVMYMDGNTIKSKVIDSADAYPVYNSMGDYIAFIEHWTDALTNITYYNVFYPTYVEQWNNEGGNELLLDKKVNVFGLPIHYHNFSDTDYNFGESVLDDIRPLLDELEDIISKMGDAIYVNTLNPLPVAIGQRLDSSIPADAIGYCLNLDVGDFKVVNTMMDYQTIKLYLDNVKQFLNDIACVPNVLGSNTNVANVSEVSLKILFHMALIKSEETEKWLVKGFRERIEKIKNVLSVKGIDVNGNIDIGFNLNMPKDSSEVINCLKAMAEMGAISKESIIEKSGMISDVKVELNRLNGENVSQNVSQE